MSAPAHLSDLVLDRLLTGEDIGLESRAHLAGCAECGARRAALEEAAQAFRRRAALPELARKTRQRLDARPRRSLGRFAYGAAGALAAAAVLLLLVRKPDPIADLHAKGGVSLDVFRKRGAAPVEALLPRARVFPGDALRFAVKTPQPGFVAVVSIDGAGAVSTYYPQATELAPIAAGKVQLLDGSIELDDTLGAERLLVLVCRRPLPTADVRDAVAAALARVQGDAHKLDPARVQPDCAATSFWLDKVATR